MNNNIRIKEGLLALSPLFIFLMLYACISIVFGNFHSTPIIIAFLVSCIYSLFILSDTSIEDRFSILAKGASRPDIMTMIWIFIIAGAFSSTAKHMGAIDATVHFTLNLFPSNMVLCGIFLSSCLISLSIGTSVGTIAALTPIAYGIYEQTGESIALLTAVVIGGSFFGDNLSFISDTTIMATKTQGCKMQDKFIANIKIAIPAAIICLFLYYIIGNSNAPEIEHLNTEHILLIPYIYIIITAISGINVIITLATGTFIAGAMGLWLGKFNLFEWMEAMNVGIMQMSELIIVTLLAAGMIEVIKTTGGIEFLMQRIAKHIHSKKWAEMSIAGMVILTDFCTANNTIAILTVGQLSREIAANYHIEAKRVASILDTFSCFAQGIIPYGAQILIASSLANTDPFQIIPYLYYPYTLGIIALLYILFYHEKNSKISCNCIAY